MDWDKNISCISQNVWMHCVGSYSMHCVGPYSKSQEEENGCKESFLYHDGLLYRVKGV
jgi:hypothetical protein